jgi:23S rRNA U2552 (ribose-2'-O)-methylase RlmE/FtsJ
MEYNTLETWGTGGPLLTRLIPYKEGAFKHKLFYSPESRALQHCKNDIDHYYQEGKWDDYKKVTNPYEYVFLSWNRRSSRSVATRQPLSRSYFKMIELWKHMDLSTYLKGLIERDGGFVSAHAAEGPGGFIEACVEMCKRQPCEFKSAYAITLRSEAKNVPGWRKALRFLTNYPQISIHDGADGTGDILLKANQDAFVDHVLTSNPNGVHIFTADGGFDFSNDYNAQEDAIMPLLLAELLIGLRTLSKGGCLIVKCFDTTEQPTLDLLWLISRAFCHWGLVKPRTSRAGNAERYIIGKGFLGNVADIIDILEKYQENGAFNVRILQSLECDEYKAMLSNVCSLQEKIEHLELNIIRDTLDLIRYTDTSGIRNFVKANIQRSIEWCIEHMEDISTHWTFDLEKHLTKETHDLMHILNPPTNYVSYSSWSSRSTINNHLSFDGFRNGILTATPPEHNPFMRLKKPLFEL